MSGKYFIGCSGYYYSSWKNGFYPANIKPRDWLAYYSLVFNTVELNGTFYRTPKVSDLKRNAEVTPPDFRFSVKMSKAITHISRLKEQKTIIEFQDQISEGLGNKINYFLFQMPPSFHYNEENLDRIIENVPHSSHNVVELRHISWWNEETEKAFRQAGLTFCNIDFPGLDTYFIHTSDHFYLRLHGNPVLFKSLYEQDTLKKFVTQFPKKAKQLSVYFNNTYYEAGYTNASQLIELIKDA